jgi:hypothetical protein
MKPAPYTMRYYLVIDKEGNQLFWCAEDPLPVLPVISAKEVSRELYEMYKPQPVQLTLPFTLSDLT